VNFLLPYVRVELLIRTMLTLTWRQKRGRSWSMRSPKRSSCGVTSRGLVGGTDHAHV